MTTAEQTSDIARYSIATGVTEDDDDNVRKNANSRMTAHERSSVVSVKFPSPSHETVQAFVALQCFDIIGPYRR